MTETPKNPRSKKSNQDPAPPRRLLRSRDDRWIWGVAGGLGEQLGINPILVRIAFGVSTAFGGFGILAYLALAIGVPEDDGTGNPVDEEVGARVGRVLLVCLVIGAAIVAALGLAAVAAWGTATGHGAIVAGVVIAVGIAIAVASLVGEVRRTTTAWLIAGALVLALPAGAVAAAGLSWDDSIGQREYRPAAVADIPQDGYELGTGQLIVDLRDLPWKAGQRISVRAKIGAGQLIVSVPANVCVEADATGKAGELLVAGEQSDGVDPDVDKSEPNAKAPVLDLDAEVQLGQLVVTDEDPDRIGDNGADYDHNREMEDAQRQACGR